MYCSFFLVNEKILLADNLLHFRVNVLKRYIKSNGEK